MFKLVALFALFAVANATYYPYYQTVHSPAVVYNTVPVVKTVPTVYHQTVPVVAKTYQHQTVAHQPTAVSSTYHHQTVHKTVPVVRTYQHTVAVPQYQHQVVRPAVVYSAKPVQQHGYQVTY